MATFDPDDSVVERRTERLRGALRFTHTRVPERVRIEHLEEGYTVDEFLSQFPSVRREQVTQLLRVWSESISESAVG